MVGLKALLPQLAKLVGTTPAALYERQRALVRAGLLQGETGRGPGSGVRATPNSMAMLLITLLASDSLSETENRAKVFAKLKSVTDGDWKPTRCSLTDKPTFASALACVLGSKSLSEKVFAVMVSRNGPSASIFYRGEGANVQSLFGNFKPRPAAAGVIDVQAQIDGHRLRLIGDMLEGEPQ